jgi:diguanylate cyclase (GGDEF)-like protein
MGSLPRIGLLLSRLNGSYTRAIWPEVLRSARLAGASVFVFAEQKLRRVHEHARLLDALIIAASDLSVYNDRRELEEFLAAFEGKPRVFLSAPQPGGPAITIDNEEATRAAVLHLIRGHGIKDIAYLSGPPGHAEADERLRGYASGLRSAGVEFREEYVVAGNFQADSGPLALRTLFGERRLKPRAVVCANDLMARALVDAASDRGMDVPRDLAVIGFDDSSQASSCRVPLTTVRQPFALQARKAVETALGLLSGKGFDAEGYSLPTELVVRRSCGCRSKALLAISAILPAAMDSSTEAWAEAAEETAAEAMASSRLGPEEVRRHLRELVSVFASPDASDDDFLSALERILALEGSAGGSPSAWHAFLSTLHNRPLPWGGAGAFLRSGLLQKARIVAEEAQARSRFQAEDRCETGLLEAEDVLSRLLMDLSLDGLGRLLCAELPKAGIPAAVIAVREPASALEGISEPGGNLLRALCAYRGGKEFLSPDGSPLPPYPAKELFPPGFAGPGERADFFALSLRHGEEEYGLAFLEATDLDAGIGYEAIARQIGSVLKGILIQEERRYALDALNEANKRLFSQSRRDELTGLLNRRGFYEEAKRILDLSRRLGEPCVLFFMDMDDLKVINDGFGHETGDEALRGAASVLSESFRSSDAVGRFGGDEFVALSISEGEAAESIMERLAANLAIFNATSGKPFKLSLSIGSVVFSKGSDRDLEGLLREADAEAYRDKVRKKAPKGG